MVAKRKPDRAPKAHWLRVILAPEPVEIVVEAAYYAVRELKQLSIPHWQRKEHLEDAPQSEPTMEGRTMALRIVSAIEAHEGIKKADLSKQRVEFYIDLLLTAVRELMTEARPVKPGLGTRLLKNLRARH